MSDPPLPDGLVDQWKRFFEDDLPPGQDSYDRIFSDGMLFPLQRRREMEYMMKTARRYSPRVVFEIGADKGGGLYHWCASLETVTHVIACEIRGTPYCNLFEEAFPDIDFLWLPQSSFDPATVSCVSRWLGGLKIDCLFLDGLKSEFDRDFNCYRPMLANPSVTFVHDIQDKAPGYGYWKICQVEPHHFEFIDTSESKEALDAQAAGVNAASAHEGWLRHWGGRSCGVGTVFIGGRPE
jgi:hypothetical protein